MKTSRVVPYTEEEMKLEDEDLTKAGWKTIQEPEGRMFYYHEEDKVRTWTIL